MKEFSVLFSLMNEKTAEPCLASLKEFSPSLSKEVYNNIFRFSDILKIKPQELSKLFIGKWNNTSRLIAPAMYYENEEVKTLFCRAISIARGTEFEKNLRKSLQSERKYSEEEVSDAQNRLLVCIHHILLKKI